MTQAFAAYFALNHLNTALLTYDATVLHAFVFTAIALVIFDGAKDLRAKQTVSLGFEGSIVDGLRLLYFTVRPLQNLLGRCETNSHSTEVNWILGLLKKVET